MNAQIVKNIDENVDVLLTFNKDKIDKSLISNLSGISEIDFSGELSESLILYTNAGKRIFLLGKGEIKDSSGLKTVFQKFIFKNDKYLKGDLQVDFRDFSSSEIVDAVTGISMAAYNMGKFKTDTKEKGEEVKYIFVSEENIEDAVQEGIATGETINNIRSLIDAPPNQKTPEFLANYIRNSAKKHGYSCEVKDKSTLEKEGFGALLAVGSGSINEPRLIKMSYTPKPGPIDVGLVGKGITFDSGGLSIKPSQNLHYLKSDMGGAAAVIGAIELAARLKLNVNITAIVASAENAVDAESFRPGDVITSFSGKTIEIIDTDAEGRLVLADGISFIIKEDQPKRMIDLATLTGSVVRALGYSAAGMFTSNKEMAAILSEIGEKIDEKVWQLPLYKEFEADLHSDLADIRNFSNKPIAGAITAAKFLEAFTEDHENWVHLDIAGVSFGDSEFSKMKSASGYGVRLLVEYIKTLS